MNLFAIFTIIWITLALSPAVYWIWDEHTQRKHRKKLRRNFYDYNTVDTHTELKHQTKEQ